MSKIKTYVGSDGKLHFVNSGGADSVLPFSSGFTKFGLAYAKSYGAQGGSYSSLSTLKQYVIVNFAGGSYYYATIKNNQLSKSISTNGVYVSISGNTLRISYYDQNFPNALALFEIYN